MELSDLGLETVPRHKGTAGRKPVEPEIFDVTEISSEDLVRLDEDGPHHATSHLKKLRTNHYQIARYVALGFKSVEIAEVTGYSPATISTLLKDPQFREVVEHYREMEDINFLDTRARLHATFIEGVDRLHDVLRDDPDVAPSFILQATEKVGGMIGFSPKEGSRESTSPLNAEDLREVKNRAAQLLAHGAREAAQRPPGGSGTPEHVSVPKRAAETEAASPVRDARIVGASSGAEADWIEVQGKALREEDRGDTRKEIPSGGDST